MPQTARPLIGTQPNYYSNSPTEGKNGKKIILSGWIAWNPVEI
jgi:hypothetical protein